MVLGLLYLLYSSFADAIIRSRQADVLSEWEARSEAMPEGEAEPVVKDEEEDRAPAAAGEDFSGEDTAYDITRETESMEAGKEGPDCRTLTVEDFFPLKIIIPKIELEMIVNEGADTQTLKKGPGHISETPLPGDIGRCTISGHRTTYGSPFRKIGELEDGDFIYLETVEGEIFIYVVTGREIVRPKDVYILEGSDRRELLLTSCHPEYSADERIIIITELINIYPLETLPGA